MAENAFTPEDVRALLLGRHEKPGDVFMQTHARDGLIVAPGVYCGWGAKRAREIRDSRLGAGQKCTYNAVYGSGWAIAAMIEGLPDMGFHDLSLMSLIGRFIVLNAHPLPVIFDAETGFGNYVTLTQTVQAYHDIGVSLAHMEDQIPVRKCGNLGGKQCVPAEEMVTKIRSWLMASHAIGTSMRLMVRTDALTAAGGGLNDAIERAKRYMDTEYQGLRPTMLWADAMMGPHVIEPWVEAMRKHDPKMLLALNYSPNKDWGGHYRGKLGRQDPPTYEELYDNGNGFSLIFHTILQARADFQATHDTFEDMAANGAKALWDLHERQRTHPVGDSQAMSGVKPWQAFELFAGGEEAAKRFAGSQGYGSTSTP